MSRIDDVAACHVRQHHRHEEWADAAGSLRLKCFHAGFDGFDRAHAGGNQGAGSIGIGGIGRKTRVLSGLDRRGDTELAIAVHTASVFLANRGVGVEALDFASEARLEVGGVEASDRSDSGNPCQKIGPGRLRIETDWRNGANSGYDDASRVAGLVIELSPVSAGARRLAVEKYRIPIERDSELVVYALCLSTLRCACIVAWS